MATYLLAYLSGPIEPAAVRAIQLAVAQMATMKWTLGPPEFVDDVDHSHNTRPGDQSIRTVGAVLPVTDPGDNPDTPRAEVEAFVNALAVVSREQNTNIDIQFGKTFAGTIERGVPDRGIREGLVETW